MTQAQATVDFSIPAMREWERLPEDTRAEVINGKLYLLPVPTTYHQEVVGDLFGELRAYVKARDLGKVYLSNTGVFLKDGTNVIIPDVVFVEKNNPNVTIERKGIFGPSDLHIEVLSPSNRKYDQTRKKILYEQSGVREYWIVDPETKDAWGYLLEGDHYDEPLVMNSKLHVRVLNAIVSF